jgi:hypothetical protein
VAPLLLLLFATGASAEGRFLHSIPLTLAAGVDLTRGDSLRVSASANPTSPRRLSPYTVADEQGPEGFRDASFVIDFDEPSVEALRQKLVEEFGESPSRAELVRFTHDFVTRKGLDRGFELASQVARHASGDCTEHAVLLTALARAAGKPARVVLGVVLLREGAGAVAYGHAWAEIYEDGAWQVGEATALNYENVLGYIAVAALRNEGPGYGLPLVEIFAAPWFKGVEVRAAASKQ